MITNTMEQLQKELDALKSKQRELELQIQEEQQRLFKIGEYVKCVKGGLYDVPLNNIYQVIDHIHGRIKIKNNDYLYCTYSSDCFVRATRSEIEKYLLDKAAKLGWKIGGQLIFCNKVYPIANLLVRFSEIECDSQPEKDKWSRCKSPFVSAMWNGNNTVPVDDPMIRLVKNEIIVEVDGHKYIAQFDSPDYVTFGCAHVAIEDILNAYKLISKIPSLRPKSVNIRIEAVQIGKGLFTREILEKLVNKISYGWKERIET